MIPGHQIKTAAECECRNRPASYLDDYDCPVCDGGLAVCKVCGAAESELDGPCVGHTSRTAVARMESLSKGPCPLCGEDGFGKDIVSGSGALTILSVKWSCSTTAKLNGVRRLLWGGPSEEQDILGRRVARGHRARQLLPT